MRIVKITSTSICYIKNNKFHRSCGYAIIFSNSRREWWKNGKKHRLDGPAIIFPLGYQQ